MSQNRSMLNWGMSAPSIVSQANAVSLSDIALHYGVSFHSDMICCPLPSHKGGKESSASFKFYPDNNSFYCFGCKAGSKPVHFVSLMEEIEIDEAAQRILSLKECAIVGHSALEQEFTEIHIEFSHFVREKIRAGMQMDDLLMSFDDITSTMKLKQNQLEKLIYKIKEKAGA